MEIRVQGFCLSGNGSLIFDDAIKYYETFPRRVRSFQHYRREALYQSFTTHGYILNAINIPFQTDETIAQTGEVVMMILS